MMRPLSEWRSILKPGDAKALDWSHEDSSLTADEVFDIVVRYRGGVATGYEVRMLVRTVYGIDLSDN